MEYLKIDLFIRASSGGFLINGKDVKIFHQEYQLMYYKHPEKTMIITDCPRELLAWNIPIFSVN